MINRLEKLSLLSEMIVFAKYDKDIRILNITSY